MMENMHQPGPTKSLRFSLLDVSDSLFTDQQISFPIDPELQLLDIKPQEPQSQPQHYSNHPRESQYPAQQISISSFEDSNAFLENSAAQLGGLGEIFMNPEQYDYLFAYNQPENGEPMLEDPLSELYEAHRHISENQEHMDQQALTARNSFHQSNHSPDFNVRTDFTMPNFYSSAVAQIPRWLETQRSTFPGHIDGWLNDIVAAAYDAGRTEAEIQKAKNLTWEKHHMVLSHRGIKVVPQVYAFVFDYLLWHWFFPSKPFPKKWPTIIEEMDPQLRADLMHYSDHQLQANNSQNPSNVEQLATLSSVQATPKDQPSQAEKEQVKKKWQDFIAETRKSLMPDKEFNEIIRFCQRQNDQWAREERDSRPGRGGQYMPRDVKNKKQERILANSTYSTRKIGLKVDT